MDNTIDIRALLEQAQENAEATIKEGAARTVELGNLIAAIGWAVEAYVKTISAAESRLPGPGNKRAVTLVAAGVPEAFGVNKDDMFQFADIIYNTALSECGFGAGDPGEGAI